MMGLSTRPSKLDPLASWNPDWKKYVGNEFGELESGKLEFGALTASWFLNVFCQKRIRKAVHGVLAVDRAGHSVEQGSF